MPAQNEEELIIATLSGIPFFVDRIYVCNDASTDRTGELVKEFMARDGRVVLINHKVNTGVGGAIIDCHKMALDEGMDIIAVMAGDDQMDPAYLPALLAPLLDGRAAYTKGNRLNDSEARQGMSRWRYTGNFILTLFSKFVTGNWTVCDPQNGYTAITSEALRKLPLDRIYKGYLFENDMLVKLNAHHLTIVDVPMPARYKNEVSGINYYSFITKGLLFMLRAFLWRMKVKYIMGSWRPPRLYRASGGLMTLAGGLTTFGLLGANLASSGPLLDILVLPATVAGAGVVLLLLGKGKRTPERPEKGVS